MHSQLGQKKPAGCLAFVSTIRRLCGKQKSLRSQWSAKIVNELKKINASNAYVVHGEQINASNVVGLVTGLTSVLLVSSYKGK